MDNRFKLPLGYGEEEVLNIFSRWLLAVSSDGKHFSYFNLQVTLMFPFKFRVSWPFGSGEKVKKKRLAI